MDMDPDLRSRVVALEHQGQDRGARLATLEEWRRAIDILNARKDEAWLNLNGRFNDLDKKISDISNTLRWINKLIIGGIIAGVIAFMIKGGFAS